jgi:hypothetical protein
VRHWLELLNSCDALAAAAPAHSGCVLNLQGKDLPAFRASDNKVLLIVQTHHATTT